MNKENHGSTSDFEHSVIISCDELQNTTTADINELTVCEFSQSSSSPFPVALVDRTRICYDVLFSNDYEQSAGNPTVDTSTENDLHKTTIEETYSDPILQQILLDDGNSQCNFDAAEEGLKLQKFFEGNVKDHIPATPNQETIVQAESNVPSTAYRIIKCFNCGCLFDIITFENHTCEYDATHQIIEVSTTANEKATKGDCETAATMDCTSGNLVKKPGSERIIMENQIRIRRQLKDELKFDINASLETSELKKGSGPNECNMCERKFVHPSGLVRHMEKHALDLIPTNTHHTSTQSSSQSGPALRPVLKCGDCGRIFYDIQLAQEHVETHYTVQTEIRRVPTEPSESKINFKLLASEVDATLDLVLGQDPMYFGQFVASSKVLSEKSKELFKIPVLNSVLQCEYCEYVFSDISCLFFHEAMHMPQRPFECTACDININTLKESINHFQTECGLMREIYKQLYVAIQRFYVCNVCEIKFVSLEQLYEHRNKSFHYFPREDQTYKGRLSLPCEYCDALLGSAKEAANHHAQKHQSRKRKEREQRSTNITASGRMRQYLCDICGKSYTQSSHLWQHLRFHQGVKPFVCQEDGCGRKFTIRPDLNDHIRKCHTGERPYHCLVCGKRFLTGSVFYQHRLIHRGERRYECDECGKRFYRADALKNHQRIHTGEKPYSCFYCTKTFRQRGDRDKHIRARHAHLDENSRIMMQMQKYQLEAAAAAAALKAKALQSQSTPQFKPDMQIIAEMFPQTNAAAVALENEYRL